VNPASPPVGNGIVLAPLTADDAAELAPLLDDPGLHRFIGGQPLSLEALTRRYRRLEAGAPANSGEVWLNWVIRRRDGRAIGTAQATLRKKTAHAAWVIARPWQSSGHGRAVARALVAWLKARHGVEVIAHIHPGNVASERVAGGAGLEPTDRWVEGELVWSTEEYLESGARAGSARAP
jgi:RimJ/RimL family protein N-acetyltransferase